MAKLPLKMKWANQQQLAAVESQETMENRRRRIKEVHREERQLSSKEDPNSKSQIQKEIESDYML